MPKRKKRSRRQNYQRNGIGLMAEILNPCFSFKYRITLFFGGIEDILRSLK